MEQALVLASIVLGVASAFELEHLNNVLRSRKVTWHWAQPLFAVFVLMTIIAFWWGAASKPEGELSLGEFLPVMFQLILLALLAAVSFPDSVGEEGVDLAEYYQDNRRYQWSLMALYYWSLHAGYVWRSAHATDDPGTFAAMVGPDTVGGLIVLGMIFARRWLWVAAGFVVLSVGPLLWLTRTIS